MDYLHERGQFQIPLSLASPVSDPLAPRHREPRQHNLHKPDYGH